MKILIDINHPAHVHLFRNAAKKWIEQGNQVIITIRDRDIVASLLDSYQLDYTIVSRQRHHLFWTIIELLQHNFNVLKVALKEKPDILVGTSSAIGPASKLISGKSIYFDEDDADYHRIWIGLSHPLADKIASPTILRDRKTRKYVPYNGLHELAYLHPNNFQPDPSILDELGVKPGETYFILRMVALKAYHDTYHSGISYETKKKLIDLLSQYGKIFITNEGEMPPEFRPYQLPIAPHRVHHAINYASMLICDGQTMTIEAAVLGIPAIRINTFVGKCSVIEELEHTYGLTYGFLPQDETAMLDKVKELLNDPDVLQKWQQKREFMLKDKCDLTEWMVNYVASLYKTS